MLEKGVPDFWNIPCLCQSPTPVAWMNDHITRYLLSTYPCHRYRFTGRISASLHCVQIFFYTTMIDMPMCFFVSDFYIYQLIIVSPANKQDSSSICRIRLLNAAQYWEWKQNAWVRPNWKTHPFCMILWFDLKIQCCVSYCQSVSIRLGKARYMSQLKATVNVKKKYTHQHIS